MDRGKLGEDQRDTADASDDRISHSILGLGAIDYDFRARPPETPGDLAEPAPGSERSFLHLDEIALLPFPAPRPTPGEPASGNGAPPTHSFLDLASDSNRPLPLSGGMTVRSLEREPEGEALARPVGRAVLGLPSRVAPASYAPVFVSHKAYAHAPFGTGLAKAREGGPRGEAPDPAKSLFADLEHRSPRAFPVERGILISLALHFVLVVFLGTVRSGSGEAHPGLLAALRPPPKSAEQEVPIIFHEAPGPERPNNRRSDFSDRNRVAGGGDRAKPKSDTPFIPELRGKEGLTPGAGRTASAKPAAGTESGRGSRPAAGAPNAPDRPAPEVLAEERPGSSESLRPPASAGTSGAAPGPSAKGLPDLTNVIQREAQNSLTRGTGENGAGIPNPDGGFVDSGPISFETSWYDWGPYAEEMVRRIKLHWDIPKLAELGWKGKLTIHFNIRLDGSVEGATLVSGSGVPPFDFAAMQAILKSNPFRPLPKDLIKLVPGKTKEGITVTFFYNIRPERDGKSEAPR